MNFWQLTDIIQLTRSLSSDSSGKVMRNFAPRGCLRQLLNPSAPVSSPVSSVLPAVVPGVVVRGGTMRGDAGGGAAHAGRAVATIMMAAITAAPMLKLRLIESGSPW